MWWLIYFNYNVIKYLMCHDPTITGDNYRPSLVQQESHSFTNSFHHCLKYEPLGLDFFCSTLWENWSAKVNISQLHLSYNYYHNYYSDITFVFHLVIFQTLQKLLLRHFAIKAKIFGPTIILTPTFVINGLKVEWVCFG